MTDSTSTTRQQQPNGHEPEGISTRGMAAAGAGLLLLVILIVAGAALAFRTFVPARRMSSDRRAAAQHVSPGVQANQAYDRGRIKAAEQAVLSSYQWRGDNKRNAAIPIERAMQLMAESELMVDWQEDKERLP